MKDRQLITIIKKALDDGLLNNGINSCSVLQSHQPSIQGRSDKMVIYITKLFDTRVGWRKTDYSNILNEDGKLKATERQRYETTFQISAFHELKPNDINSITASDLANIAVNILEGEHTRLFFRQEGISILRVTSVRNPYFTNDKEQYEASPSFDIIINHSHETSHSVDHVKTIEGNIKNDNQY